MTARLQPRYKFTYPGREAPYGVTDYPSGGRWSEKRTPVLCQRGWHIPTNDRLSNWIKPELWEVRVKGQHVHNKQKEAWEQIRFVRKIEAWNVEGMTEFIKFCRPDNWQKYIAYAADADAAADAAVYAAYAAVYAAYAAVYAAYAAVYAAYAAVRLSQSNWIIENIINANGGTSSGS